MNDLFNLAPSLSPRMKWLKEHRITVARRWDAGHDDLPEFSATNDDGVGYGPTEDDAIVDLARGTGLRLWNEQTLSQ